MRRRIKKAGIAIVGGIVLLAGIAMIPYPGPGWVTVFLGLGILSTEFEWAERILHFAKDKYDAWQAWLAQQNQAVKAVFWLLTAMVVVATIWLLNGYGLLSDAFGLDWDWAHSPLPLFQ
jgi:uncharacterized protein (TIGR02611 family)